MSKGVRFLRLILFVISAVLPLAGCGTSTDPNRPQTAKVTGTVTYNQQPLEGANVVFAPQDHTHAALGTTDSSGRFQLRTFETNDGAVPGNFKVTVIKFEQPVATAGDDGDDAESETRGDDEEVEPPKSLVPERYGQAATTELEATVTADGENSFTFELTD